MKRLLLLMPLLMAFPAHAEISSEVKATCMEAKDFVGCVQALSGGVSIKNDDGLSALRNAMKQVAARLDSGTSLSESTLTFQPVVDQLAVVKDEYAASLAVKIASKSVELFNIWQASWQSRINTKSDTTGQFSTTRYSCNATKNGVSKFDAVVGSPVVGWRITRGLFGISFGCQESVGLYHERKMMNFLIGVLNEGSVSPGVIEKYYADRAEKYRLANMSAWERHLDKNSAMKQWAAANPAMATTEQAKFNTNNPQKEMQIPSYVETLRYLSKFNPPL